MTEGSSLSSEAIEDKSVHEDELNPRVRWVIPHRLDFMTFVGRDVLAVCHDIYIVFLNLRTNTELVYVANNEKSGDGVDVISGFKSQIFAFAEKVKHARIFIVTYPSFNILSELKDMDVNRYKGLCMMECDLVAGFTGFPNYLISVWNWRTNQRLISMPTGVIRRSQIYMASRSHMLVCECWGEGLIVWEVAQCFKRNFMMKRAKPELTGWEVAEPPLVGLCWTSEGQLYAIDPHANLYSLLSDGIGMVTNLEWSEELKGNCKPSVCAIANGILIYGPDGVLRSLKKCESSWKCVWTYSPREPVARLVGNSAGDGAALWTDSGLIYRILADSEDKIEVKLFAYKQRNIKKIQAIAPEYNHVATMDNRGMLCIYEVHTAKLVTMKSVNGSDVSFQASPVEALAAVFGETAGNYGLALYRYSDEELRRVEHLCLTHQVVSVVVFSPSGRHVVAAAMAAGHIFIMQLSEQYQLSIVRYAELGRGLADCMLMKVGDAMRCFSLVLFSDKYPIGERIICINAETGKDNKFAGKMQGPYSRLLPLGARDSMLAVPHLSRHYHVLRLAGDKGVTVSVKMGPIIDTGHDVKYYNGYFNSGALLTYGYDGTIILRQPTAPEEYELKYVSCHRYEPGISQAVCSSRATWVLQLASSHTTALTALRGAPAELRLQPLHPDLLAHCQPPLTIVPDGEKNYLDLQEDKRVHEEALDYRPQREEVVRGFQDAQARLVALLEENLAERPLHQLSLAEFNLHQEHKKERLKQAEKERETIRLQTEALIRGQDKVTAWIKQQCWDTMLAQRTKLYAIFSHYQVENYPVLPNQREKWPELQQIEALRAIEKENDADLFRPWEEVFTEVVSVETVLEEGSRSGGSVQAVESGAEGARLEAPPPRPGAPHALAASAAHRCVPLPPFMVPQTLAYTFLHMDWLQHIVKLNVQNMRLWFNKQFDELMSLKKREVGLVEERNARLRFIIEELNKLSDLRGSFHHLIIEIKDPQWRQEEQPEKLIKVEPEECSIEPYISPSQIVIIPPDPGPKDDFRERALIEMMDGVLEKLWHEEIKKPIPMPQCMLDKDPEHFNEDDLKLVFEYEAKVAFRNEERDKYRKMLHAEYAKLTLVLNEGIVKFNHKVKENWLLKLKVDSIIGQENLSLMRLRRTNLDRVEMAEKIEVMRANMAQWEAEAEQLGAQLAECEAQGAEVQAAYDALAARDRHMDRSFKNHFADLSPIIVDQCYKFFKKRPKWHQRATLIPTVLYELANAVLSGARPAMLHPDCVDFFKGVEQLDLISNMPPVMDEPLWATMCKLRRAKIENEVRMRAVAMEMGYVESTNSVWSKSIQARRSLLALTHQRMADHRQEVELTARNKTIQLVLPAGQVEIPTTGHMDDFEDATLIRRTDIEAINDLILKVGAMKLRMMRKQMEFRKGILAKEWEHAQMKMKLRHMQQELHSYQRLKIPKELQQYLKNKELGYTDEQDYVRMEKEMEASKMFVNRVLAEQVHRIEDLELKLAALQAQSSGLEKRIRALNAMVSEKRLNENPLEPIRIRRIFKNRMATLVTRSKLIREVQANHTTIVMLQTELELLRLKTFPTLASFRTLV